jgi:hypothetical protein
VKNQYFGDNRDLFKYDLVLQIIQAGLVNHFTFIPMLTEPDGTKQGGKIDRSQAKVGTENKELMIFLDGCVREGKRDIEQLKNFFARYAIKMTTYYGKDRYFSHGQRQEYFEQIGDELLSKSLIFIDPDTGLEIQSSSKEHILYSEVKTLYDRMDKHSILMIFQYFPREEHHEYLHHRSEELEEKVAGEEPISIDDNEILFFFLTRDDSLEHELTHIIEHYAEGYS